jgi:hypothetical protein
LVEHTAENRGVAGSIPALAITVARALFRFLVAASLVALVGCRAEKTAREHAARTSLSPSAAQALRTCVDRWNQGNMLGWWGPTLANVSIRRLDADQLAAVGLRDPALPRCTVSLAVHSRRDPRTGCSGEAVLPGHPKFCVYRRSTYVCIINRFGGYGCPTNAEGSPPLRHKNATTDKRGVLKLDVPLKGTHATPSLAWQRRYPHTDGWIEPWTPFGKLRPGLRFTSTYSGGGSCSRGSQETVAKTAVRCLWRGLYQVDPCFPQRPGSNRRGAVVACPNGQEATTFGRFVIGPPSYRAIDFPVLLPWTGVGAIQLGETRAQVAHDYDAVGHRYHVQARGNGLVEGYYVLHRSRVDVDYRDGRVNELDFTTRFYRTWDGFGVGSRIPLGPCHRTATASCEHRWQGFVWNAWVRDKPCSCWVKVGDGKRSLPATPANFLKHWVFVYVRHGRVTRFHLAQKFVD